MEALNADSRRPEIAIPLLEKAVALDSRSALALAKLGTAEISAHLVGDGPQWLEQAAASVSRSKSINPDSAPVLLAAGLLEQQHGAYEAAIRDFSRAIELEPSKPDGLRLLARPYEDSSRPGEPAAAYLKAIAADRGYYRSHVDFGNFHYFRGDFSAAEQNHRQAVATAPKLGVGHMNLGLALTRQGRFSEAEASVLKAVELHSTPNALMNLGVVYYSEGRFREAAASFSASLRSGIPTPFQYKDLGDALRQLGRKNESVAAYREALRLDVEETGRNPRQAFLRALLGQIAARLGDGSRAVSETTQALAMEPGNAAVIRESVITYDLLGDRKRALALLVEAQRYILRELARNPDVSGFKGDPAFRELLKSANSN